MNNRIRILALYLLLAACIALQLAPAAMLQTLSAISFLVMLFIAKHWSKREDRVLQSHALYYYRTIWIWSLLFTLGTVAMAAWLYSTRSTAEILELGRLLAQRADETPELRAAINIGLLCIMPSFVYLAYRMYKGVAGALKNAPIQNPKTLF